ncbi:MAG: GNAT family N-acetyltransferase [Clostridia bacterium]|nr:GNAT family N-acetyltransferase [Clostridia bacterium]
MIIRKALPEEFDIIMSIYSAAQDFMAQNGNETQWGKTHPDPLLIKKDIENGELYVCTENDTIACVFFFRFAKDPTYDIIYNGAWQNDEPYGVVHRIASTRRVKGAAKFCLNWAFEKCKSLRIDTHKNNIPMQSLLTSLNFKYCGIIHLESGDERMAYHRIS